MSQTEQILDRYVESQGWTRNTVLDLALTYIENQASPEAWEDYLASLKEVDDDLEPAATDAASAWKAYEAAGMSYQAGSAQLVQACLMGIALTIRESYPTATHVVLGVSDQGPYLSFTAIIDPECGEDDNEIEEPEEIQDDLWSYAGDLDDDDHWGRWTIFTIADPDPSAYHRNGSTDPTGRMHSYVLDLDLILWAEGDSARLIADLEEIANR